MQSSQIWSHSEKGPSGPCSSSLSSLLPGLGLWVPEGAKACTPSGSSCVPASLHGWGTSGEGRSCHTQLTMQGHQSSGAHHVASFLIRALPWAGVPPPPEQQMVSRVLGEGAEGGQGRANSTCSLITLLPFFKVTGGCLPSFVAFLQIEFGLEPCWLLGTRKGTWERKQLSASQAPLEPHPRAS